MTAVNNGSAPGRSAAIISLGCSKNLVDSERLMAMLADVGFKVRHEPHRLNKGDIVIINTCGFIQGVKRSQSIRFSNMPMPVKKDA